MSSAATYPARVSSAATYPAPRLFLSHGIVNQPTDMVFMPDRDHVMCCICGKVFQPALNRLPIEHITEETQYTATGQRKEWSRIHARTHPQRVHDRLRQSGRLFTPEATEKLASYGISPVGDMVFDGEVAHAALLAPRCPTDDVES